MKHPLAMASPQRIEKTMTSSVVMTMRSALISSAVPQITSTTSPCLMIFSHCQPGISE